MTYEYWKKSCALDLGPLPNQIYYWEHMRFWSEIKADLGLRPNQISDWDQIRFGSGTEWDLDPGPNQIWIRD